MEIWKLLADIVLLLLACLIGGGIASRFKQSPLLGYLLGGMLVGGPGSLNFIVSQEEIEAIAELGVALLLFSLGLEFSLSRLRALGAKPLLGGVIQVAMTLLLGALAGIVVGLGVRPSIALGAMVALSSTAVVLRILMERGEIEMPHGRNGLGVLLIQDIAVVPLALLVTVLGGEGEAMEITWQVVELVLLALGLAALIYVSTKVAIFFLSQLTLQRNRELTVIFAAAMGLGSAWAAHWVGVSPALGAFIAGLFLGGSKFSTQIRADVSTLRVLLLTLFFGSAGMVADPVWIFWHAHWVAAAAIALTVGKMLIVTTIFLCFRQSLRVSLATGLTLAQLGEFAFVLGAIGRESGVVSDDLYALVVSVTIVSFIISAVVVPRATTISNRIALWWGKDDQDRAQMDGEHRKTDVVVVGFGPSAQLATVPLNDADLNVVVIDLNFAGIQKARECGFAGEVGDATLPEVLEHASIGEADLAIVTIPHFQSCLMVVELIHAINPSIKILVRSRYHIHAETLKAAGGIVLGDEEQIGSAMKNEVANWLGLRSTPKSSD